MDWYPWYPDLHDADAGHLTCLEDGAYRRLIDRYMRTRMPLPDDDKALARFVGLTPDEWAVIAPNVRAFFKTKDGKLHHKRCNLVLEAQDKKAKSHSEHASHAAKARWAKELKAKENNAQSIPNESDEHAESNADSMLDKCPPDTEGNAQSMLKNARGEEKEKRGVLHPTREYLSRARPRPWPPVVVGLRGRKASSAQSRSSSSWMRSSPAPER